MNGWSEAICATNEIEMHYTRTGGNKQPLVLLHGLMTSGVCCWTDLALVLEGEYDVIMPDARGHGGTSAPDSGYQYEDHASDVVGLIEALGLHDPILLGHSMGGMTAAVVASRKPHLLRAVILADPTFLSPEIQQQVYKSAVARQHQRILEMTLDEVLADVKSRHPDRSEETNMLSAQARLQTSMAAFGVLRPPNPDYKELVKSIDVPCFMVFGDRGVITSAVAEELHDIKPNLKVEEIQNAGHSVHRDQPEHFANTIKHFMLSI